MGIGVICEGPTDFVVIEAFIKAFLFGKNIETKIVSIQPTMDNTREGGGWSNLLLWLKNNPPQTRVKCSIPDDHIDPRRSAFFMAKSILRDIRSGVRAC